MSELDGDRKLRSEASGSGADAPADHEVAWDLLPWYVNGTLEEADSEAVRAHLVDCGSCRDELTRCQALRSAVRSAEVQADEAFAPSPDRLASLLERLPSIPSEAAPTSRWSRWGARLRALADATPGPTRWLVAGQTALATALVGVVLLQPSLDTAPRYETRSTPSALRLGHEAEIEVVFAPQAREAELRALLRAQGASIVRGPTASGVYGIALAEGASLDAALAALRAHPQVRFAEPLEETGP